MKPFVPIFTIVGAALSTASTTGTVPSVVLGAGTVAGAPCTDSSTAVFFKGIPYAKPPVGNLRFRPPIPFDGRYDGNVLNATAPAPSCIQFASTFAATGPTSEDCLYLDVYAPRNATPDAGLPVRVWLFGGSNTNGGISDPLYNGCAVVASNALQVNVNYRLGPLGFLALDTAGIHGNQGIQDQLLALQWVQDNIKDFGGDPDKVMLHGQSAGAQDAFLLATLPQAPKLFSSVILESGGGRDYISCSTANQVWSSYAQQLNCSTDQVAPCLTNKPVEELLTAFDSFAAVNTGYGHYPGLGATSVLTKSTGPFVDGEIVPAQPSEVGVQVPSIFGFSARDGAIFVAATFISDPLAVSEQNYTDFLNQDYGNKAAVSIKQHIPFSSFDATGAPGFFAMEAVYTLSEYQCPAFRALNKAAQKGLPTWAYDFNHTSSCPWIPQIPAKFLPILGGTHTSEIPFVFGLTTNLPVPNGTCKFNSEEVALSKFMLQAWTNMAKIQKPTTENTSWPQYTGAASSQGITINDGPVAGAIDFSACALFDGIENAQLAAEPNTTCNATSTNSTTPVHPVTPATNAARQLVNSGSYTVLALSCVVMALELL